MSNDTVNQFGFLDVRTLVLRLPLSNLRECEYRVNLRVLSLGLEHYTIIAAELYYPACV